MTYILIAIMAIIILARYINSKNSYIKLENKIVLGFAIAGAVGNLIDRVWKGHVINYIHIANFTPINLAYIYLIITWIGMAILLTKYTIQRRKEGKIEKQIREEKEKRTEEEIKNGNMKKGGKKQNCKKNSKKKK